MLTLSSGRLVCGESLPVLVRVLVRNDFSSIREPDRDLDNPCNARSILVAKASRGSAVCPSPIADRPPPSAVEPVEEVGTRSASVPALGPGTKDREEEAPAGVGVALTLASIREILESGGEPESGGHGPTADAAVVPAEEVGARALDCVGVAAVGDGLS